MSEAFLVEEYPWIKTAIKEIGVKEIYGERDNPRIIQYHQLGAPKLRAQSDEVPWCAAFVGWVLVMNELPITGLANARSYLSWGYRLPKFRPGCVVVFSRGSSSWQGHVGFALREGLLYTEVLGGNQSDAVNVSSYRKNRVLGYMWHSSFDALLSKKPKLSLL